MAVALAHSPTQRDCALLPYYTGQNWNKHCTSVLDALMNTVVEQCEVEITYSWQEHVVYESDPPTTVDLRKLEQNGTYEALDAYLEACRPPKPNPLTG